MHQWKKHRFVVSALLATTGAAVFAGGDGPLLNEEQMRAVRALRPPRREGREARPASGADAWLGAVHNADESQLARLLDVMESRDRDRAQARAMVNAAEIGCARVVRLLLVRLPAGSESVCTVNNALAAACRSGKLHCVRVLLAGGVCTPEALSAGLCDAVRVRSDRASRSCRKELVSMLLEAGADPNYSGGSVLSQAIEGRCPGVVRRLLADPRVGGDLQPLGRATRVRQESEAVPCCEKKDGSDCCDNLGCCFRCRCVGNDFDPPCYFFSSSSSPYYSGSYNECLCPCAAFLHTFCCAFLGRRLRIRDDRRIERMVLDHYTERTGAPPASTAGAAGNRGGDGDGCCGCWPWCRQPSECAICLGELRQGDGIARARCGHRFHTHCLAQSVRDVNSGCPLCRRDVCPPPVRPHGAKVRPTDGTGKSHVMV